MPKRIGTTTVQTQPTTNAAMTAIAKNQSRFMSPPHSKTQVRAVSMTPIEQGGTQLNLRPSRQFSKELIVPGYKPKVLSASILTAV